MSDAQGKRTIIAADLSAGCCRGTSSCATMRRATAGPSWRPSASSRPTPLPSPCCELCDGARSVEAIAAELAETYNAPKERILADITALLQELADKGVVSA